MRSGKKIAKEQDSSFVRFSPVQQNYKTARLILASSLVIDHIGCLCAAVDLIFPLPVDFPA